MSFSQDNGYVPETIEDIMDALMAEVNTQFGTSYTSDTFVGTNFYKYFYAMAQKLQLNEVKTAEIFLKLQQYFLITNESIARPVVTAPGLIENLLSHAWAASVKAPEDGDAGKIFICVDVHDDDLTYDNEKITINTIIKNSVVAGVVTQGTEVSTIVLSNGQSFDFKYNLPNRITILLRLTTVLSENNQIAILTPEQQKANLLLNIYNRYGLGKKFEPQRYFSQTDAPWASSVLLEWSDDDGGSYHSTVYDAAYDDLFTVTLANTELVET